MPRAPASAWWKVAMDAQSMLSDGGWGHAPCIASDKVSIAMS